VSARELSRPLVYALVAVGVLAASFGAILVRLAGDTPPLAVAAWRLTLTSLVMIPVASARGTFWAMGRREVLLSVMSGVALAAHFVLWIASLRDTTVASSVLFVTTHPIFVALGARFVLGERSGRGLFIGIAVACLGGALIGSGDVQLGGDALRGDLLALAGGFAVSVYFLIGRVVRRSVEVVDYVAVTYGVAALLVCVAALLTKTPLIGFAAPTYLFLVLLAIGPQLIGHTTFNWALKHLPASRVTVIILGEPIGSSLLALAFFSEMPTWLSALGAVIILCGIALSLRSKEEPDDQP